MNKIQNNGSNASNNVQAIVTKPTPPAVPADLDAAPLGAAGEDKAATFDRAGAKRPSVFAAHSGGDSRVVSPAGGAIGQVNNTAAVDAHSKKEGDFSESRTLDGKTLFLTPEGARAVDAMLESAKDSSAPVRAESDPDFWERLLMGDPFAGREQHSGKTKR